MDIDRIVEKLRTLPVVTPELPGIGGELKLEPSDFQVEELPLYEPCGEGEHVYIRTRRVGMNTPDVAREIAHRLGESSRDVGWAGMKDKQAVAIQTLSIRQALDRSLDAVAADLDGVPFEILGLDRHKNKLKAGHCRGNRFTILLSDVDSDALGPAQAIAACLLTIGFPNYYGEQRFGRDYGNIEAAFRLFENPRPRRNRKNTFLVSALQSMLFNVWLAERIDRGQFRKVLAGDVMQKTDSGGIFTAEDVAEVQSRFDTGDVIYTGPMFGSKTRQAEEDERAIEDEILNRFGLGPAVFKRFRAPGSRRPALVMPDNLSVQAAEAGLQFCFDLPSGSYATVLMREFT